MPKARAVARAARQAEKIHEEIYGKPTEESPDEILDGLSANDEAATPEAEPASAEPGDGAAEPVDNPQEPVEGAAEPAPEPEPQATDNGVQDALDKLDHKYKVLQGMHRKLLEENMELRNKVSEMASKPPAPAAPASTTAPQELSLLSAEEIEDYGSDMITVMKKAAREAVANEVAELRAENLSLRSQISGVTTQIDTSAKNSIYGTLDSEVSNWREINQSDDFLVWLNEPDLFSGKMRQDLLTQAFEDSDAARVVRFFKAYLNEDAAVAPVVTNEPVTTEPVTPKVDMKSMVAPGKPKVGGAPGDQTDTRIFTSKEINDFYRSVQLGKFPGTDADKTRMEKAIVKAANEGRVTN
jgi:hypothetical protein